MCNLKYGEKEPWLQFLLVCNCLLKFGVIVNLHFLFDSCVRFRFLILAFPSLTLTWELGASEKLDCLESCLS